MADIDLKVLGGASLEQDGQGLSGPGSRRHPVALLTLLALAPSQTMSREKVLGYLWPETEESIGRNRLTSVLYALRKLLGKGAIESAAGRLQLDKMAINCDLWRFLEAIDAADHDAIRTLYAGPLLDGFHLEEAPEFDERIFSERERIHSTWRQAIEQMAASGEEDGDVRGAVECWRLLYADDPLDSQVAEQLVRGLLSAGNRREAARVADSHRETMLRELDAEPEFDLQKLVATSLAEKPREPAPANFDSRTTESDVPAIAVLPFELLHASGAEGPGLAEGLHSGILTRLSSLEGLSVIARMAVRNYDRSNKSTPNIARELGVRWVFEGDIQQIGQQFHINVRLTDAPSERQAWASDYTGVLNAETFFQAQAEIAGEIVERLCGELSLESRKRIDRQPTASLEALRLCALGRDLLDKRSEDDMRESLDYFERALEKDPNYALARVGLADALGLMHSYGYVGEEVLPRAGEAIEAALKSDSQSGEAHAAKARLLGQNNQYWEAEREMRLALSLKPSYAEGHNWLAVGLQVRGAIDEAVESATRAVTLNPLSVEANANLVSSLLFAGRAEEALSDARQGLAQSPDFETVKFFEGLALYELGRYEEAADVLEGLAVVWSGVGAQAAHALSCIACGREDGLKQSLEAVDAAGPTFDAGLIKAARGDLDGAFEAFKKSTIGGIDFATSYWAPVCFRYLYRNLWSQLERDDRYQELAKRIDAQWGPRPN